MARASQFVGLTDAELAAIATNAFRRAFAPSNVTAPLAAAAERAWGEWLSDPHQLTPIPRAAGSSPGPASTRSALRSPASAAAAGASATPVRTSTDAMPAR